LRCEVRGGWSDKGKGDADPPELLAEVCSSMLFASGRWVQAYAPELNRTLPGCAYRRLGG